MITWISKFRSWPGCSKSAEGGINPLVMKLKKHNPETLNTNKIGLQPVCDRPCNRKSSLSRQDNNSVRQYV